MNTAFNTNILIVDDEMGPRESLKMILKPYYNVFTAENAPEALKIMNEHPIDLATLDYKMPGMTGTELLKEIRKVDEDVSVIMITGFGSMKSAVEGIRYGVSDYLVKPFEITEIIEIVKKNLEKKRLKSQLKTFMNEMVQVMGLPLPKNDLSKFGSMRAYILKKMDICLSAISSGYSSRDTVISSMKDLIYTAENNTSMKEHSMKVAYCANLIGTHLNLDPQTQENLEVAAWLHDIGMFGISYWYLNFEQTNPSSFKDFVTQKPKLGANFCAALHLPEPIIKGIAHQMENFNGSGFPDHLSGNQIPLISRIIRIAEWHDDLQRKEPDPRKVLLKLQECSGKELDPELVNLMADIVNKKEILSPMS